MSTNNKSTNLMPMPSLEKEHSIADYGNLFIKLEHEQQEKKKHQPQVKKEQVIHVVDLTDGDSSAAAPVAPIDPAVRAANAARAARRRAERAAARAAASSGPVAASSAPVAASSASVDVAFNDDNDVFSSLFSENVDVLAMPAAFASTSAPASSGKSASLNVDNDDDDYDINIIDPPAVSSSSSSSSSSNENLPVWPTYSAFSGRGVAAQVDPQVVARAIARDAAASTAIVVDEDGDDDDDDAPIGAADDEKKVEVEDDKPTVEKKIVMPSYSDESQHGIDTSVGQYNGDKKLGNNEFVDMSAFPNGCVIFAAVSLTNQSVVFQGQKMDPFDSAFQPVVNKYGWSQVELKRYSDKRQLTHAFTPTSGGESMVCELFDLPACVYAQSLRARQAIKEFKELKSKKAKLEETAIIMGKDLTEEDIADLKLVNAQFAEFNKPEHKKVRDEKIMFNRLRVHRECNLKTTNDFIGRDQPFDIANVFYSVPTLNNLEIFVKEGCATLRPQISMEAVVSKTSQFDANKVVTALVVEQASDFTVEQFLKKQGNVSNDKKKMLENIKFFRNKNKKLCYKILYVVQYAQQPYVAPIQTEEDANKTKKGKKARNPVVEEVKCESSDEEEEEEVKCESSDEEEGDENQKVARKHKHKQKKVLKQIKQLDAASQKHIYKQLKRKFDKSDKESQERPRKKNKTSSSSDAL